MATVAQPLAALKRAADAGLLPSGQLVAVACSGGLDSIALVRALAEVDQWPLRVVTINHRLRPGSDDDAQFVVDTMGTWRVDVVVLAADPLRIARGEGPEDAARRERYRLLAQQSREWGAKRVVTAHTADDQAETVVMRLASGCGLRGAAGIPPLREPFARPWLLVTRGEIRAYAESRSISWREDPTNREMRFLRNQVRHRIRPSMAATFGNDWVLRVAESATHLRDDLETLEHLTRAWDGSILVPARHGIEVPIDSALAGPKGVRRYVLRRAIVAGARRAGVPEPRSLRRHVAQLERLTSVGGSRSIDLPEGLIARRKRGTLHIGRRTTVQPDRIDPASSSPGDVPRSAGITECNGRTDKPGDVVINAVGRHTWAGWQIIVEALPCLPDPTDRGHGCLRRDSVPMPWRVRTVRPGERFKPLSAPGSKRVVRLWSDAHIAVSERGRLPIIEVGGRAAWVARLRIAHWARAGPDEAVYRISLNDRAQGWRSDG